MERICELGVWELEVCVIIFSLSGVFVVRSL